MSFHVFTNGSLSNADYVMDNFYHIFRDDRLPFSITASGSLSASDNTVDLGSSTNRWNKVYANEIIVSSCTITSPYMWNLKLSVTLSSSASSVEFTGINGDNLGTIILSIHAIGTTGSEVGTGIIIYNADTAANYAWKSLISAGGTSGVAGTSGYSYIPISGEVSSFDGCSDVILSLKSGMKRMIIADHVGYTTTSHVVKTFGIWSNSSSTITSIKILGTGNFRTGSAIRLWGIN